MSFRWIIFVLILMPGISVYSQTSTDRKKTKVTMGFKPDYFYTFSGMGVKVKETISGKAAEAAGIKAGDIIIQLDSVFIKSIFTYQDALAKYSPGDRASVLLMRKKEKVAVKVTFR